MQRHTQIDQRDIGPLGNEHLDRFPPVPGFGNNPHVGLPLDG
jgi:hypothetical protein